MIGQAERLERKVDCEKRRENMLWTIIIILLVLWALGFGLAREAVGGLVHILIVIAVIVLVLQLVRGRRGI